MSANDRKITAPWVRARKGKGRIAAVTAYDATFARLLDEGGADILLVGDSLGMVVQGLSSTLPVTVQEVAYHCRAVARGARRAHIVADLPFMSYQASPEEAFHAAAILMKEGNAEAVKLEGGTHVASTVARLVESGVPVMGHVGLTPQSVHRFGGFRVQGRSDEAVRALIEDVRALESAGAYAIVVEGVPSNVAEAITQAVGVPTIGIGAGPHCDGQVLVCYDFLGLFTDFKPRFVRRFADLGQDVVAATRSYVEATRAGSFPTPAESFEPNVSRAKPSEPTGAGALSEPGPPGYGPPEGQE